AIASFFSLLYLVGMPWIAPAFTSDRGVIDGVVELALLMALPQPVNAVAFVFDGVFIGANDAKFLLLQIAVSCLGVFVPMVLVLTRTLDMGLPGLWAAMALFSVARALFLMSRYRQSTWVEARIREAARS
ncbi:MAG: hypothetical protein ACE5G2_11130, partial [Candidatus Krumholzibacteriia bacterium]